MYETCVFVESRRVSHDRKTESELYARDARRASSRVA